MNKLGLFYFSGTGNTKLVASHIGEEFTQMGWEVSIQNIEEIHSKEEVPDMDSFDLIGMGAQVIGYTTPRRMNQFLQLLPTSKSSRPVFLFRTCGGVVKTNYTASHSMIHYLKKLNYEVFYERLFSIGSNWIFKFDDSIIQQLYEATKHKVTLMCHEVVDGKRRFYKTTPGLRFKKKVISGLAKHCFPLLGKNMKTSENCVKCGLCTKRCPENNIRLSNGKLKFGTNCTACLRCLYECPTHAISFRLIKFIPIEEGYNVKRSLSADLNDKNSTNGKIPPFFESYIRDDTM